MRSMRKLPEGYEVVFSLRIGKFWFLLVNNLMFFFSVI
jgi:hypothetical protein